jgi:UDP-N-acetylmuramate--alanine ligase
MMLSPVVSLVTNIDPEHLDHYGSVEALERSFVEFANKVPFYGFTVLCLDHPRVQVLIPEVRRRVITYGFARRADVRATNVESDGLGQRFRAFFEREDLGEFTLRMPGQHNVQNALGAIAVAREIGVPLEAIRKGLAAFTGVQRRFTIRGEAGGVVVVDDYGHHPVEIEATLQAAEQAWPDKRIVAVFQPHRYSRVQSLFGEFCGAFHRADEVLVLPVYAAGEAPLPGIDHATIGAAMRERGHRGVAVVEGLDEAVEQLAAMVRPGDAVITLGAGNVNAICDKLLARLGAAA